MPKLLPLNSFVEQVAQHSFDNWDGGGDGRIGDLFWPAIIYGVPEVDLERKVRAKFQDIKAEYNERFIFN
jgi:hypothetical protein